MVSWDGVQACPPAPPPANGVHVRSACGCVPLMWRRTTAQMEYLLSHIEKLMNHLKHEAAAKVKAYSAASKYDGDLEALRNRNAILAQRNATREHVITELKVPVSGCCALSGPHCDCLVFFLPRWVCVCACAPVCLCACVRACVRVCVKESVRACVRVHRRVPASWRTSCA
jgi:hypothetical protein